ncbi:nuclear transport factor 2 family protein [Kribbella sp. NBC_00662]|uniref:nuclear transport factor 2 family protein n=1 Tax=Kribbella sp. NBC_00662 TaxID=2975969 RepID=UPI00352A2577
MGERIATDVAGRAGLLGASRLSQPRRSLARGTLRVRLSRARVAGGEYLEYIAKPHPFKDLAVHDVKVRILGDVALIHGRSTYTMLTDGTEQEALHTDAYQKRNDTWQCISACTIAPGT